MMSGWSCAIVGAISSRFAKSNLLCKIACKSDPLSGVFRVQN